MKQLDYSKDHEALLNQLCDLFLKRAGVEAFHLVKQVAAWMESAVEKEAPAIDSDEKA